MRRALVLIVAVSVLAACGDRKGGGAASTTSAPASGTPAPSASASPAGPESPLSVVVEGAGPLVLASLEGGLVVTDAAHTRWAHAVTGGDLVAGPIAAGLPEGPGQVLGAAGRIPGPIWLLYEKPRDDGKAANPLFRLGKEGWKQFADDWRPALAAWTKHRILAMSTSSGRLKIKVIEPSLPAPPDDIPSARLGDAACEKSLHVEALAALPTGEVFAAGNCKPDTAAGAGTSSTRYVVIRWTPPGRVERAVATKTSAGPGAGDAGASDGGSGGDAGAADAGVDDNPGTVDVIPGVSGHLRHVAFLAVSGVDVWSAAVDVAGKPAGVPTRPRSWLFHFDGASWGAVALPPNAGSVRALAGAPDGGLWLATDQRLFRRTTEGSWDEVPLPSRAFPGEGSWEIADVAAPEGRDLWVSARRITAAGARHVILRSRPAPALLRWE